MEKIVQRRFSLEDDFMNFKTDDLLYGFLRCLSTARPVENKKYREYLPIKEYHKNKKVIANVCGVSTKTLERHLNALFDKGLLDQGLEIVEQDGKQYEYECFWFPYDENGKYKILERDMVRYLIDTRNAQCIKVYLYLLNKYEYKKNYTFTIAEIQKALGYSTSTTSAIATIGNILESFAREGLIEYEDTYDYIEKHGEIHKIPVKELHFVASSIKQLPKVG